MQSLTDLALMVSEKNNKVKVFLMQNMPNISLEYVQTSKKLNTRDLLDILKTILQSFNLIG